MKTTPATKPGVLDLDAGPVSCIAGSERGELVLGTTTGEIQVLRLPTHVSVMQLFAGQSVTPSPQHLLRRRVSPTGSRLASVAVTNTPAGGAVAIAADIEGVVSCIPVAGTNSDRDRAPTTAMGEVQHLVAAFAHELFVAASDGSAVTRWQPERDGLLTSWPSPDPISSLALLAGRDLDPIVVVGTDSGFTLLSRVDLTPVMVVSVRGGVIGLAAWRWPDGSVRVATVSAAATDTVTIWPIDPDAYEYRVGRDHRIPGADFSGVRHTRGLLGLLQTDGSVDLMPLAASGHQRLPPDPTLRDVTLMRSPDGRPTVVTMSSHGATRLQLVDLVRRDSDELLTLNNDSSGGTDPDLLGFDAYARPLAIVVAANNTDTPLVMAIDGQWGQGKTRLGRMVEAQLPRGRAPLVGELACQTLWFNAWMHSDAENPATALAGTVSSGVQSWRPWWKRVVSPVPGQALSGRRRIGRLVATAVGVLIAMGLVLRPDWREVIDKIPGFNTGDAAISVGGLSLSVGLVRLVVLIRDHAGGALNSFLAGSDEVAEAGRVDQVREDLGRRLHDATRPIPDLAHPSKIPFFDRLRHWSVTAPSPVPGPTGSRFQRFWRWVRHPSARSLGLVVRRPIALAFGVRTRRRVVLFVDDLDRCDPARSVATCQALSQLLDHPNMVTVVMVDTEALATQAELHFSALAERSHPEHGGAGWGRRFLEKIFQFEFSIPAHRSAALSTLLRASLDERAPTPLSPESNVSEHSDDASGLASLGPLTPREWTDRHEQWPTSLGLRAIPNVEANSSSSIWDPQLTNWIAGLIVLAALASIDQVSSWGAKAAIATVGVLLAGVPIWITASREIRASTRAYMDPVDRIERLALADGPSRDPFWFAAAADTSSSSDAAPPVIRREEVKMVLEEGDHLDLAYREASRWLDGSTPRTAKRLANRLLFTTSVAIDRNLLWTDSALDGTVIGKWVALVERWPGFATAIRGDPNLLRRAETSALDAAIADRAFAAALDACAPNVGDTEVLRQLLQSEPALARHSRAFAHFAQ